MEVNMKKVKDSGILTLSSKKFPEEKDIFDVNRKYKNNKHYGKCVLRYSTKQSKWTNPGHKSSEIINHGNGFIFKTYINGKLEKTIELDYASAQELRALLKLMDIYSDTFKYDIEKIKLIKE